MTWRLPPESRVKPVTAGKGATIFYNDSTSGEKFVIMNNRFLENRRYGVLLQSHDGLVAGNYFAGTSGNAILLMNTMHSGSGFIPYNIVIRNNCFVGCYTQKIVKRGAAHAGVVASLVEKAGYRKAPEDLIENISIRMNYFLSTDRVPALRMQNTINLDVGGNILRH